MPRFAVALTCKTKHFGVIDADDLIDAAQKCSVVPLSDESFWQSGQNSCFIRSMPVDEKNPDMRDVSQRFEMSCQPLTE